MIACINYHVGQAGDVHSSTQPFIVVCCLCGVSQYLFKEFVCLLNAKDRRTMYWTNKITLSECFFSVIHLCPVKPRTCDFKADEFLRMRESLAIERLPHRPHATGPHFGSSWIHKMLDYSITPKHTTAIFSTDEGFCGIRCEEHRCGIANICELPECGSCKRRLINSQT